VDEKYVVNIPPGLDPAAAAPLLCAGVTTYSPMKHHGLKAGQRLAVVGLGGLGHMGVKIGKAFGAFVAVISRGTKKREDALKLGADAFIDSTDPASFKQHAGSFDFVLDTVSAQHDIKALLDLLGLDGKLIMVGAPPGDLAFQSFGILGRRLTIAGSLIGGIAETQEMLNFCAEHGVVSDIELIAAKDIPAAHDRTVAGDVKFRFVIDIQDTL